MALEQKMIKPIETYYNGYKFRSRLEARWAVFFDALKISYQYELEGFDLGIFWYLPDFYLTEWGIWIEIKPVLPIEDFVDDGDNSIIIIHKAETGATEIAKILILKEEWNKIKKENKQHFIFYGTPGIPKIEVKGDRWRLVDGCIGFCPTMINGEIYLCVSTFALVRGAKELDIWPYYMDKKFLSEDIIQRHQDHIDYLYANPVLPKGFISRIYHGEGVSYDALKLKEAYAIARQARFEKHK